LTILSVHKDGIATGFSDVAESYADWAEPQRRMAERLIELLPKTLPDGPIVDVCCGDGLLTNCLQHAYPKRVITGLDIAPGMIAVCRRRWKNAQDISFIVADVETDFPVGDCALIASNCGFQWFQSPAETIMRMTEALKPGGFLAASVPVAGSLPELCDSYRAVLEKPLHGIEFLPDTHYVEMTEAAGLCCRKAMTETVRTEYDSAWDVLRSFKHTGTTFRHQKGYAPLPVNLTRRLAAYYEKTFAGPEGRVPATYRTLYLVAEAKR